MPVGHLRYQALSSPHTAITTSHLGICSSFIEKNKPPTIEMRSPEFPCGAPLLNIGPVLFGRMKYFF
jgi:hypothetical protein